MHPIRKIGSRGYRAEFDELVATEFATTTNVYILEREEELLLFDTFLGSRAMEEIFREENLPKKPVILVNSHSDWDHLWGNGYFSGSRIIGHANLPEALALRGELELEAYGHHAMGEANPLPPTETFESKLDLGEGMHLFHTPGHTLDSISLWDDVDKILYVGNNAEAPIPSCIDIDNIEEHRQTLESYLQYDFEWIAPGHGDMFQRETLEENLDYLKNRSDEKYFQEPYRKNHLENLSLNEKEKP